MKYRDMLAALKRGNVKAKREDWEAEHLLIGADGIPFLEYDDGERTAYRPGFSNGDYDIAADDWKVVSK